LNRTALHILIVDFMINLPTSFLFIIFLIIYLFRVNVKKVGL
jgi:hypothetical protein